MCGPDCDLCMTIDAMDEDDAPECFVCHGEADMFTGGNWICDECDDVWAALASPRNDQTKETT